MQRVQKTQRARETIMHEKTRTFLVRLVLCIFVLAACFLAGFERGCAHDGASERDTERLGEHTERSAAVESAVAGIDGGIRRMEEQVQSARNSIDASLTGVGELKRDGDRIAEKSWSIAESVGRIEERLSSIESVISEAEKNGAALADSGSDFHSD